jgi:glycosyltransferase involved in cell wall biosynthesis
MRATGNVLHIMNYAAAYRGNFIESLEYLNDKKQDVNNYYMFMEEAKKGKAYSWISEMEKQGRPVYFFSGNMRQDITTIIGLIKKNNISLIHSHFISMKQFLSIYIAVKFVHIPIVMHMHNHSQQVKNLIKKKLRRFLYAKCIMIACSKSVYDSIERDYPRNKKFAVDNGVNFNRLDLYETLPNSYYGLGNDSIKFLTFGFDFYRKGVDLSLKALKELKAQGYKVTLLISLSTNFDEVNNEIVKIVGEMPNWVKVIPARNDVATLYNFADIFLSPSREEGLPYSVIEAAYSRCNIVLSDISAQRNLKIPYAYWFNSEDIEDFKEKILMAIQCHDEKVRNMDYVKQNITESYALKSWADEIIKIYDLII